MKVRIPARPMGRCHPNLPIRGLEIAMEVRTHESRRHGRYPKAAEALLDFNRALGPREATTLDLSVEGAAFRSHATAPVSSPVILRLRLERHAPPLEAKGKVCWSHPRADGTHGFGIRFLDLTEDDRARLVAFIGGAAN